MRLFQLPLQLLVPSLLFSSAFATADPLAIAIADAAPVANPLPLAKAEPEAEAFPVAVAEPHAKAVRQAVYNNAPFSGAIYIVGANGAQLTSASAALCPNQAPQGCGNIGVWNWCCPTGNTCAWASSDHSVVGCCPSGSACSGSVNKNAIQTVTVYVTTTQYGVVSPTTVGAAQTVVTVAGNNGGGGVFINGNPTSSVVVGGGGVFVGQSTRTINVNGYCSTLYANGPNLPTTAQGACGTILVLNEGSRGAIGWRIWSLVFSFYGTLGLLGWFGFRRV